MVYEVPIPGYELQLSTSTDTLNSIEEGKFAASKREIFPRGRVKAIEIPRNLLRPTAACF